MKAQITIHVAGAPCRYRTGHGFSGLSAQGHADGDEAVKWTLLTTLAVNRLERVIEVI